MTTFGTCAIQTDDELNMIAGLLASDHSAGGVRARLQLLEYGDYECGSCSEAELETRHLVEVFGCD